MGFRRLLVVLTLVLDAAAFSAAWLAAFELRRWLDPYFSLPVNPRDIYIASLPLIAGIWIVSGALLGLYTRRRRPTRFAELVSILRASVVAILAVMSVGFLFKEWEFARMVVFFSALLTPLLLLISRRVVRRVETAGLRKGRGVVHALVVGTGETAVRALQSLQERPDAGVTVHGLVDDDPAKVGTEVGGARVLGTLEDLARLVAEHGVEEIFFAKAGLDPNRALELIADFPDPTVSFRLVSNRFNLLAESIGAEWIGDFAVVPLRSGEPRLGYRLGKRALDLVLGLPLLLVSLPLWLLIAIGIRATSRGPALLLQDRVGLANKRFRLVKFRTMRHDTELYAEGPTDPADERITGFGRFLRRLSLDELPQLLNIVLGQMSLVGPRPEMPFLVEQYSAWQRERLRVKPGLTGLWQILGRKDVPLHENLEYDFYYIKNRSLALDLTILLLTVPALLFGKGAY